MRQVKFRYWNGSKVLNQEAIINHLNKYIARNDKHLMQFTGLFDKQGVEIYEGDIIKYDFNNLNYRIEFINAEFIARRFYENIEDLYPTEFDFGKECEVLGNIYENPELLNDELKAE